MSGDMYYLTAQEIKNYEKQAKRNVACIGYIKILMIYGGVGFFIGSIVGVILFPQYKAFFLQMQKRLYYSVVGLDKNDISFFIYCVMDKIKLFVIIIVLTFTIYLELYGKILFLWNGMLQGIFFSASIKCYGGEGWGVYAASLFPHDIIYFIAIIMALSFSYNLKVQRYVKGYKMAKVKMIIGILASLLLIFLGGYLECTTNLDLLKLVLKKVK